MDDRITRREFLKTTTAAAGTIAATGPTLLGAHDMHIQREGNDEFLYFCDDQHGIVTKRTLKGEEVWTMGYPQEAPAYDRGPGRPNGKPGLNYRPTNIAVAPNGDFWVVDGYGSYYAFHYDKNARLKNAFGGAPAPPAVAGGGRQGGAAAADGGRGPQAPPPIEQMNNPHGVWLDTRDAAKPML